MVDLAIVPLPKEYCDGRASVTEFKGWFIVAHPLNMPIVLRGDKWEKTPLSPSQEDFTVFGSTIWFKGD